MMTEQKEKSKTFRKLWQFNPIAYGLEADFHLTRFKYVESRERKISSHNTKYLDRFIPRTQISLDSSATPFQDEEHILAQTTGIILPFIDDPYVLGRIAGADVFGEMYAIGVTICDSMLMLFGVSMMMTNKERDVVLSFLAKGLEESAAKAGTAVKGRQITVAPSCTVGARLSSVCHHNVYIVPNNAVIQDVLILTKPLGSHLAVNEFQVQKDQARGFSAMEKDVRELYLHVMDSMTRLNLTASRLMHKYNAHGAANVGGLGILGHALKLASYQKNQVSFVVHSLPVFDKIPEMTIGFDRLKLGLSPETSGGLLICLAPDKANAYLEDFKKHERRDAWIIGSVEGGNRSARIIKHPTVIVVPFLGVQ